MDNEIFTKINNKLYKISDGLEFITKIISSPKDVLQFLQQLMRSPEDGLQIMNKFINSPADALKMINKMMNQAKVDSTTGSSPGSSHVSDPILELNEDPFNNSAQLKVMFEKMTENMNVEPTVKDLEVAASPVNNVPTSTLEIEEPLNSPMTTNSIIDEIINGSIRNDPLDTILCEAIKLEYEGSASVSTNSSSRELNDVERAKLNELIVANKALYAPVEEDLSSLISDDYQMKVIIARSLSTWQLSIPFLSLLCHW